MTKKEGAQMEAVDTLKQWGVVDGSTVYAKVNKVSASGLSRKISLYWIVESEETPRLVDISYQAGKALGWPYKDGYNGGITVHGCGMDMLAHTVSTLSYVMGYGEMQNYAGNRGNTGLIYRSL